MTVEINGIQLHYETLGNPGAEPLLLLHGGTGCCGDWVYAGRDELARQYHLIMPDARGHGRSTNPGRVISHRQNARDALALLDRLDVPRCKAIGMSFGGNTLLHVSTMQPQRIDAMVLVSATMSFPDQARAAMRHMSAAEKTLQEWETMRGRHKLGDDQIRALWNWIGTLAEDYTDINFTAEDLKAITARTLIVYGDRDPLYPVEMGVALYRAIQESSLWVVPGGGHGPVFAGASARFVESVLSFFGGNGTKKPSRLPLASR